MDLLGSFSNSVLQERLQSLAGRLDRLAASDAVPQPTVCAYLRSQPGAVLRAVVRVLEQADRPLRPCDVHDRITALHGQAVLYASVKSCLAEQIKGEQPRFERTARGLYRVRS